MAAALAAPCVHAGAPLVASPTARASRFAPVRPADVPGDAELVAQGARIGAIRINSRPIFDAEAGDQETRLGRLANRLHIQTRDATLADQLLFRSGDLYEPRLIEESARILRSSEYLRDAWITPVAWHDGVVDLEVRAQDVWTLNPGLSFSRKGGENSLGIEIEDANLFGTGADAQIGFTSTVDRDSTSVAYRDRQLGSSWWSLSTIYSDNSDGRLAALTLDHPFYALDVRRAGGGGFVDDLRIDSRYDLGEVIDRYQTHLKFATAYLARSAGLRDGWATRWSAGFTYDDLQFAPAPGEPAPQLLPEDRKLVYPWIGAEWVQDEFQRARNRDLIERTEDYSLGWRARLLLGYASESLGSGRDAITFFGRASKGLAFSGSRTVLLDAAVSGRMEHGTVAGGILQASARFYAHQSYRRVFYSLLSTVVGENLDDNQQILLGGDSGLRGYPLRYQAGTGRWLFTAEQRWFSDWYPFQLFNVGGAVFYDMGATWGRDPLGSPSLGVLKDVGFGLRLGNSRSALGNVIHIDLAFPLDGDDSIDRVQIVVETRQSF